MTRSDIFSDTDTDTTDTQEATVTENQIDTADAPEAEVVSTDTEPAADTEADQHQATVDAFEAAVEAAVAAADTSTGTVSEADLDTVAQAYRAVSGGIKYKNLARKFVDNSMKAAIGDKEYIRAVSYNEVSDKLINTKAEPKAAGPKVDPKVAYGERVAALNLAAEILEETAPDEVEGFEIPATDRAAAQVKEYLDWQRDGSDGDAPELDGIAAAALKLVSGKGLGKRGPSAAAVSRAPFTGTRRNVAAHIESAFEGVPAGDFLTVGEIVKHTSTEYGDDHPSSGAVSARLFPGGDAERCTVEGVTAGVNDEGVKGAYKK